MQLNLKWERKYLSNLNSIFQNDKLIGNINKDIFSQKSSGELNGKKYFFQKKGFLNQQVLIIDQSDNRIVGEIALDSFMTKASIVINKSMFSWKSDNLLTTRWNVTDYRDIQISFVSTLNKGDIYSNTNKELLILSGLFIANYYKQQRLLIILLVLIPIWLIAIN